MMMMADDDGNSRPATAKNRTYLETQQLVVAINSHRFTANQIDADT